MSNPEQVNKRGLDRRQVLGLGAVALGAMAVLSLPLRLLPGRRSNGADGVPGAGSIFQPRPQALRDFLRRRNE